MKNSCKLMGFYGGDMTHARAAWVSTGGETEAKKERVPQLLKMLAESGHTSPFEHSQIQFQVTADYASHIHQLKHRVGVSVNTESARYKEYTEDKFYIPQDWPKEHQTELENHCIKSLELYHETLRKLVEQGVSRRRAKESARYFLPLATQLKFVVTMNFLSLVHFQKLRNSHHAQLEIREVAAEMLDLIKVETSDSFQHSLAAWSL